MKILVLQLARLGDIYMSWPALRALRRTHPGAEIHLLVRPRFEAATRGLNAVDQVRELPTAELLEPLSGAADRDAEALGRVSFYLETLRRENYDRVINLSFSPLSSWIVKSVAAETAEVSGYTRHTDGYLKIADHVSSFFYAQVGVNRPNRVHLTDLFATMINVDLNENDWGPPDLPVKDFGLPDRYAVLHVGASESGKRVAPFQWARALRRFHEDVPDCPVVLIGGPGEKALANEIRANVNTVSLIDLTGETAVEDLFGVIAKSLFLIGADSAPMHMAALTGTPTLNVSCGDVNFWETGPKAPAAWIRRFKTAADFSSEQVGGAMAELVLRGRVSGWIQHLGGVPAYRTEEKNRDDFAWNLIQALYLGADFPVAEEMIFIQAVEKLTEMNAVVLEQLRNPQVKVAALAPLLDRADEVLTAIADLCPESGVLVRWVQTEKTRIPPGSPEAVRQAMTDLHARFGQVLNLYELTETAEEGSGHGKV
ncbi:MAG: glycosyltransferase family 9 protein [Bdellovibrionaceae bacterium]|nr:glycosyltransferase family 9 protein [Pseudobdellovibrionaceae bacterium]